MSDLPTQGPWMKYQQAAPAAAAGPWTKYQQSTSEQPVAPTGIGIVDRAINRVMQGGNLLGLPGPNALERSAEIEKGYEHKPGETAGKMIPPNWQENPMLYAFGTGNIGAPAPRPVPAIKTPRPEALAAHSAGYALPPGEVMERPSLLMRGLAAAGGKVKTEQQMSQFNQGITNNLVRKSLGLQGSGPLRPNDFAAAKAPAEQAYNELASATPEVALAADPAHRAAVESVGVPQADVEKFFPEMANNPRIVQLRETLLQSAKAPTSVVRKKIADLRYDAQANFRKFEDAQAHQLGLAQVQAAKVLEDAIERSVGYGRNGVRAFDLLGQAEAKLAHAQDVVAGRSKAMAPGGVPAALQGVAKAKQVLKDTMAQITPDQRLQAANLLERYRDARKRFAQVFTVESATNMATGNVKASRLANMRRTHKTPLTGGLKSIADTHDAFPHMVREPTFGREDYSIFDAYGAGTALAHGHPAAAAAIGLRAPIRRSLTTPAMQNRMFNPPNAVSPDRGSAAARALAGGSLTKEQDTKRDLRPPAF